MMKAKMKRLLYQLGFFVLLLSLTACSYSERAAFISPSSHPSIKPNVNITLESPVMSPMDEISYFKNINQVYDLLILENEIWVATGIGAVRINLHNKTFKHYTKSDGLAGDVVKSIILDKRGYFWFATNGGLSCFDGKTWKKFILGDNPAHLNVIAIFQDNQGNIWAKTNELTKSTDGENWSSVPIENSMPWGFTNMAIDKSGSLWIIGKWSEHENQHLFKYNGSIWQDEGPFSISHGQTISSILGDNQGLLWIAAYDGGIGCYDGKNWRDISTGQHSYCDIAQDKSNNIWFADRYSGLVRYDGKHWQTFFKEDGLISNHPSMLTTDTKGNLWVGTQEGICWYDGGNWQTIKMSR
jgi:ligand-binding sensor domain-containing protein